MMKKNNILIRINLFLNSDRSYRYSDLYLNARLTHRPCIIPKYSQQTCK